MSVDKFLGPHYGILIVRTNERAMRYEVVIVANCAGAVLLNSLPVRPMAAPVRPVSDIVSDAAIAIIIS
jgi:hypothetical protein